MDPLSVSVAVSMATPSELQGSPSPEAIASEVHPSDTLTQLESRIGLITAQVDAPPVGLPVAPVRKCSQIPKPEISPKPQSILRGVGMTQSLVRPLASGKQPPSPTESTKNIAAKVNGTANMLKSTLRRMTRLSVSAKPSSEAVSPSHDKKLPALSPSALSRSRSFKEPPLPPPTGSLRARNSVMSSSLRRPRNKDREDLAARPPFQRAGTGGTLDGRKTSVNRSHSVTGRRGRHERDLNVKKSRGIQTQLTRDTFRDDEDADPNSADTIPTALEFNLYMPDLLGAEVDSVETHVSEPAEPVDARKSRQLTLENMKLHREVEKLKVQANEGENLKKELKAVKVKLEDEKRSRIKIEQQLDKHNEKVKLIVQSMDSVEREFETRDDNIVALENRVRQSEDIVAQYQADLGQANDVILAMKRDLNQSLTTQKTLLSQYHEAELESQELQEFLSAEKMTLGETLKDCENEITLLGQRLEDKDVDIANVEERCSHLVRLSEQRQQEILSLQAQLNGIQDKAKDMLLAQGAEISRANVHIAELYSRLDKLVNGSESSVHEDEPSSAILLPASNLKGKGEAENQDQSELVLELLTNPKMTKSHSQFLVGTEPSNGLAHDLFSSESLTNLSNAISRREMSETNGLMDSMESTNSSLPSLSDRISDVQNLIEKFVKLQGTRSNFVPSENLPQQEENLKNDLITSTTSNGSEVNGGVNGLPGPLGVVVNNQENKYLQHDIMAAKEIDELKSRYMKHKKILTSNYEQAESEIKRMDEIYHDTVDQMLKAMETIPEVVSANPALQQLKTKLNMDHNEGHTSHQLDIAVVLKADKMNANQSL